MEWIKTMDKYQQIEIHIEIWLLTQYPSMIPYKLLTFFGESFESLKKNIINSQSDNLISIQGLKVGLNNYYIIIFNYDVPIQQSEKGRVRLDN